MRDRTKGVGGYLWNLFLAILILGIVYQIRFLIEFFYAIMGKKINLSIRT